MKPLAKLCLGVAVVVVSTIKTILAATLTMIGPGSITDLSADGSVAVGNTNGAFETFRWTQATGVVPLGRATVPVIGTGGGTPDVSWDGTQVSATILDDAGTRATAGRWSLGSGWQQLMPPTLPDGGTIDASWGSAWGLSGDGKTVTGFYWRPGQPGGAAHGLRWNDGTGLSSLGSDGRQSSGRGVNYDGSVIVGWDEDVNNGQRRPTVWVNGVKTVLQQVAIASNELRASNADGTVVTGDLWNSTNNRHQAAIWRFNSGNWVMQDIGALPGTLPFSGSATAGDITADGSMLVGFNRFSGSSFFDATGFVWTQSTGMVSAAQFLTDLGLSLPPNMQVLELTSISADGSTIAGIAVNTGGGPNQSFIISIPEPGSALLLGLALPALVRRRRR
jgi:MYXO-CTERM domain-containing protein